MAAFQNGSLRLFRVAGVDVMIHWSWIIIAGIEMQFQRRVFASPLWNAAEVLGIFSIVLLHEIGHVTACRQVGGTADRIVLLPYGGVAVVNPPPRPWPVFWSVAGGPLMNVILVPVTILTYLFCSLQGWTAQNPDLGTYLGHLIGINIFLLVINLLPVYPNDGGQLLYAVLWAIFGRGPGLMVTSALGVLGGGLLALVCVLVGINEPLFFVVAFFAIMMVGRSLVAFAQARRHMQMSSGPRHRDAACPACHAAPLMGQFWVCDECRCRFDTFETLAECPKCFKRFEETRCPECGRKNSIIDWFPRKATASPPTAPAETPYRPHDEWDQHVPREYD